MLLLDGMGQCWIANSKLTELVTRDGRHTGMEYGFLRSLEALRKYFKTEIVVCWEGRSNFRYKIDPEYKAHRRARRKVSKSPKMDYDRVNELKKIVAMVAETAEHDELEADDVIANLAEKYCQTEKVIIYSRDKDLHQLIRRKPFPVMQVKMYQHRERPWNVGRIGLEYGGIKPEQFAQYLAIHGDTVDNIPGVKRVRKSIIQSALSEGYTMENMADFELFSTNEMFSLDEHYKSGRYATNLKLVTLRIRDDIVVKQRDWQQDKLRDWLDDKEFATLAICKECGLGVHVRDEDEF